MATQFIYTLSPCATDRLDQEIRACVAITVAMDGGSSTLGDQVTINFRADLSGVEVIALNGIIAAHTGIPLAIPPETVTIGGEVTLAGPKDSDTSLIIRNKSTKAGWHYQPRYITWTTAKWSLADNVPYLQNKKVDTVTDYSDVTLKFWKISGSAWVELKRADYLTTALYIADLLAQCVITTMDWYSTFDFDIRGALYLNGTIPGSDAWGYAMIAPDIPAMFGGSVPFLDGGFPIHRLQSGQVMDFEAGTVKSFAYDAVNKSNKIRLIVRHDAGAQITLTMAYKIYKL